jgi:hypothetical protein
MEAPGSSLLAKSLLERVSPVVLLLPTPSVEESCRKNHLGFLQILHPFCNLDQIDGKQKEKVKKNRKLTNNGSPSPSSPLKEDLDVHSLFFFPFWID